MQRATRLSHSKKDESDSSQGLSGLSDEFRCSPCVCVGFLWVLKFPPTVRIKHIKLIGDSLLPLKVPLCE